MFLISIRKVFPFYRNNLVEIELRTANSSTKVDFNCKLMDWFRSSHWRRSMFYKKVLLKVSQNSQGNTCTRLWHRCFAVSFEKTFFLKNTSGCYFYTFYMLKALLLNWSTVVAFSVFFFIPWKFIAYSMSKVIIKITQPAFTC